MTRRTFALNRGWRYLDSLVPGATGAEFDDSGWERVCLPHTNRVVPWHSFDENAGAFVSTYRRKVRLGDLEGRRVHLDFDGVMTAATTVINDTPLGEHKGGYVPFSFEITDHVRGNDVNVLAVVVDSSEQPGVPPAGGRVDYLGFGGIYRDVSLRLVPDPFVADVFAKPVWVLGPDCGVEVSIVLDARDPAGERPRVEVMLRDGPRCIATAAREAGPLQRGSTRVDLCLTDLGPIELWDLQRPKLYEVVTRLCDEGGRVRDEHTVRIGFRDARFTADGFHLNGQRVKLRGLNRHQTYPFVGGAMPERVQAKDADIIRHEFKCNIVRTSHYPQSPHFLDRCDEIGLLVMEEIPGWQHIGGGAWRDLACRDVEAMVHRDRNHASIILWGVRINESADDHDLYQRTNAIARALDDSRPTGGVRDFAQSELLEDVFTVNDFNPERLAPPHHPAYLVTEYGGHTFPTKSYDHVDRVQEHVLRHARVLDALEGDDRYAGGIAWCAFDYNTRADFGSGDGVCYHGVADIFRIAKPAAALYRSQCDPADEVVLEPAFSWTTGELHWQVLELHDSMAGGPEWYGGGPGRAVICSNCDLLRLLVHDELIVEVEPDRKQFGHLDHPPFVTDALARRWGRGWGDLLIEGYVDGRLVATRRLSARAADADFQAIADDATLRADGRDATRVVMRVTDEYGNRRVYTSGAITLGVEGPGTLIGENPFALSGGVGAVWVRSTEEAGTIRLHATHRRLGTRSLEITSVEVAPEDV